MPNTDALYKVVLNGRYANQAIVNVLYYRLAPDILPGNLNFAGAEDVAFQVKAEVWTAAMKALMLPGYTLDDITVYPYDAAFDPFYQLPYVMPIAEVGTAAAGETNGPAPCAIIRFNLEPTTPLNGLYPPKSGYVAIGPITDSNIDSTGHLVGASLAAYQAFADVLAMNLENLDPLAVFYPCRVKQVKVLGVLRIVSFADVASCTARALTSFRRSRQPES